MAEATETHVSDESGQPETPRARPRSWERVFELAEILVLALVAITTAWSGYQAAQWSGRQALLYGEASRDRFEADAASTLGGQQLVADASIFTAWLQAQSAGDTTYQDLLVRRFSPDYRAAFAAWLKTEPLTNPSAPPGPAYMPGFTNPHLEQAKRLNAQASASFTEGTAARVVADKFIRATVLFASVLFLVGLAQRFGARRVRFGANLLAGGLLAYTLYSVVTLPRL